MNRQFNITAGWFCGQQRALRLLLLAFCLVAVFPLFAQSEDTEDLTYAEVSGLNTGANLHIREAPQIDSLSLLRVPGGTLLELLGMNQARDWAYIYYAGEDDGVLRGWASVAYLRFTVGERQTSLGQLESAGLIITVADSIRGGFAPMDAPTVDDENAMGMSESDDRFYAEVTNLNPGVNLHIRRYPDSQAESFALVANETLFSLIGLNPNDDWAFIQHTLADGKQIRGWVNLDYLRFRHQGQFISLDQLQNRGQDLTISAETAGLFLNESGAPLYANDSTLYAEVAGLDEAANLHLRITPQESSQSMALLPNGTVLLLKGLREEGDWAFVEWEQEDGSSISGWVSTNFLQYRLRGTVYTTQLLLAAGHAPQIAADLSGYYKNTAGVIIVNHDDNVYAEITGLDEGANLHIRIAPNRNSESLFLLSVGTILEMIGVNESEDWAFVRYKGSDASAAVEGWASTDYLRFHYREGHFSVGTLLNLGRINTVDDSRRGINHGLAKPTDTTDRQVYAEITGLNSSANLHLRMAPNSRSESLSLIPAGSQLLLEGLHSNGLWAYVQYDAGEEQRFSGWVNTPYLSYRYRGQRQSANYLLERGHTNEVSDTRRGVRGNK